jgi:hypothetical protein
LRFSNPDLLRRAAPTLWSVKWFALFSALILITRCANFREILVSGKIYFVERTAENSAALQGVPAPAHALCRTLDRFPAQTPPFLLLAGQNSSCQACRVRN